MAETCIVCLGDLRGLAAEGASAEAAASTRKGVDASEIPRNTRSSTKSADDDETVAHLLPCGHDLHNSCLKPWVERANSCPICRATFNMVELSEAVKGPVISSYAVQDKVQEAELDPSMIMEDELFAVESWEPCLVCGAIDDNTEVMFCDGCDRTVHVFCAGMDDAPEVWYCSSCMQDMEQGRTLGSTVSAPRRRPRQRTTGRRSGRRPRVQDTAWARIWQEVSDRLDMDLDFPFDDDTGSGPRTAQQQRELELWQERFQVAGRQGNSNRFRDAAAALVSRSETIANSAGESQEELRAWNAFDKARELQDAPVPVRRRKRKSLTTSPSSPHEPAPEPERPLKRPRTRRLPENVEQQQMPESSHAALQRAGDAPTFLTSLLEEVEKKPIAADPSSPEASDETNGNQTSGIPSPAASPTSSGFATPRALSVTPPPMQRPMSPPLSSTVMPMSSPRTLTFSPFSPTDPSQRKHLHERGRLRHVDNSPSYSPAENGVPLQERASSSSPNRGLSYSTKTEVQRMVKTALGPRYRNGEVTKDQYTDINRDVSRKLYDMVGDASALADQTERVRWQAAADDEVKKAITALKKDAIDPDA